MSRVSVDKLIFKKGGQVCRWEPSRTQCPFRCAFSRHAMATASYMWFCVRLWMDQDTIPTPSLFEGSVPR